MTILFVIFWITPNKSLTAANVLEKHQNLFDEGYYVFPEEKEATSMLLTLSWVLPVIVAISALVDLLLIFVFQELFHPWRRILVDNQEPENQEVEMSSLVSHP